MKPRDHKFFNKDMTMNSIKLLIVNTILYLVFLQAFILGALTEQFNDMGLPLFTYFSGGLFALFYILIWFNMGDLLYKHLKKKYDVFKVAFFSEVPFLLIMMALWITFGDYWNFLDETVKILMLVVTIYLIVYPLVMVLSRAHRESTRLLEK